MDLITLFGYLICIWTSQSQVNNNMPLRSVNLVIECLPDNGNLKYLLEGRNSWALYDNFQILQLEKLALFNLAYFCHPPIKPKFPSRQNYPIYGMFTNLISYVHCYLDLRPKKSIAFILSSWLTCLPSLMKHTIVFTRSQHEAYTDRRNHSSVTNLLCNVLNSYNKIQSAEWDHIRVTVTCLAGTSWL